MKTWGKYIVTSLWVFLFLYLVDVFEIPKNVYYLLIGIPLIFGGAFLILYLFEKGEKK